MTERNRVKLIASRYHPGAYETGGFPLLAAATAAKIESRGALLPRELGHPSHGIPIVFFDQMAAVRIAAANFMQTTAPIWTGLQEASIESLKISDAAFFNAWPRSSERSTSRQFSLCDLCGLARRLM
jgi:hypothetical protein